MLRLVKPEGPRPPRRHGQRPPYVLSAEQERAAKAALRGLGRRYGSLTKLAVFVGLHRDMIRRAVSKRGHITADLLLRAALATKTPVEVMITPGPREVVR